MGLVAFFVASTVVTLVQYLRLRERRFLPLLALFALLALGHFRGAWDAWGRVVHFGAGVAGLAVLVMISPRHVTRRSP
jgi:ammonia channel protein AmtB